MARNFWSLTKVFGAVALIALSSSPALALSFPAAKDKDGAPDRRRGAGSRAGGLQAVGCLTDEAKTLYALGPAPQVDGPLNMVSQTTLARPDFFWYMPPTSQGVVSFALKASNGQEIYTTEFQADGQEGIARLSLPVGLGDGTALKPNQTYSWEVALNCEPGNERAMQYRLRGQITRVETAPGLQSQLKVSPRLKQAELYATNGVWNDSISALVDLQCDSAKRDESLAALGELFQSVGISEFFTQVPMLGDCDCDCN